MRSSKAKRKDELKSKKHTTANDDDDDNTMCLYCKGAYRESVDPRHWTVQAVSP